MGRHKEAGHFWALTENNQIRGFNFRIDRDNFILENPMRKKLMAKEAEKIFKQKEKQ